jgi:hypothetical protein
VHFTYVLPSGVEFQAAPATSQKKIEILPSIFKDKSTGSHICLWKPAVAIATYVSICIV